MGALRRGEVEIEEGNSLDRSLHGGSVTDNTAVSTRACVPRAPRRACQSRTIELRTHLYSPLATRQAPSLGAPLDFLLMPPARQYSLLARLRRQLVSHRKVLRAHVHRLAGRRVRWVRVVLRDTVLRRRQRRAHGRLSLPWLRLGRRRLYRRQIERRERWERHLVALRRPVRLIALGVGVGRVHLGRRVALLSGVLIGHCENRDTARRRGYKNRGVTLPVNEPAREGTREGPDASRRKKASEGRNDWDASARLEIWELTSPCLGSVCRRDWPAQPAHLRTAGWAVL